MTNSKNVVLLPFFFLHLIGPELLSAIQLLDIIFYFVLQSVYWQICQLLFFMLQFLAMMNDHMLQPKTCFILDRFYGTQEQESHDHH